MNNQKYATIKYILNEEGRRDSICKGGNGKRVQEYTVEINERIIKLARISSDGDVHLEVGSLNNCKDSVTVDYEILEKYNNEYCLRRISHDGFSKIMTVDELVKWEEDRRNYVENKEKEMTNILNEKKQLAKEQKAAEEQQKKQEKEQQELDYQRLKELSEMKYKKEKDEKLKEKQKQEEWEQERNKWIQEFGSEYLKDALKLDYCINDNYIKERVSKELPEFTIDFEDEFSWEEIYNPSKKAIIDVKKLVEQGYNARIKCITDMPSNDENEDDDDYDDDNYDDEKIEGIVISKYLDKYDLVKIIEN